MKGGWVYILVNKPHGVPYVGVTSDLAARMVQHRSGTGSAFARKYNAMRLVHVEAYPTIEEAIAREKALKAWRRVWKLRLVQEHNPTWNDLYEGLNG
jgi:putative endonuclease